MEFVYRLVGSGSNQAAAADDKAIKYNSEFHRIRYEFIDKDLGDFMDKYPLLSLVGTVFSFFFGLMTVLSLSPTNILVGAFLLTISVCFATGIVRKGWAFWGGVKDSIGQVLTIHTAVNTKPEEAPKSVPQS